MMVSCMANLASHGTRRQGLSRSRAVGWQARHLVQIRVGALAEQSSGGYTRQIRDVSTHRTHHGCWRGQDVAFSDAEHRGDDALDAEYWERYRRFVTPTRHITTLAAHGSSASRPALTAANPISRTQPTALTDTREGHDMELPLARQYRRNHDVPLRDPRRRRRGRGHHLVGARQRRRLPAAGASI